MTFVLELGIAAIANELETTMAVAVAAAMAAVMERIFADSREHEPSHDLKACPKRNGVNGEGGGAWSNEMTLAAPR